MLINIIYLTRRATRQALLNLSVVIQTIRDNKNAIVSVGYGGDNLEHALKLRQLLTDSIESRYRYIIDTSLSSRLAWSLDVDSDWILFISDDDWFSTNYVSSLIEPLRELNSSVTSVCAQHYAVISGGKVVNNVYFEPNNSTETSHRIISNFTTPFSTLRYYGAHRADIAKKYLIGPAGAKGRPYLDQMLMLRLAISGALITTSEPSAFLYDITNWESGLQSAKSDLAFYLSTEDFLSHELNWVKDVHDELRFLVPSDSLVAVFKRLVIAKVDYAFALSDTRVKLTNCSAQTARSIASRLHRLKECALMSTNWTELSNFIGNDFNRPI